MASSVTSHGSINDLSVELGRGGKRVSIALDDSRNFDESLHSSNAMVGNYRVMYTPPLSSPRPFSKRAANRKTLAEMHSKATEAYDGSILEADRPATATFTAKNTRFSGRNASRDLQQATETGNLTDNQSFMLPDLPNLSELISGTYQDGTPVFSRNNTARPGRFTSTSARYHTPRGHSHKQLDAMPIPEDEKQIFAMLKLLQEKVSALEKEKAEIEQRADEMAEENDVLLRDKKDRQRFRRSDSALGTSDDEAMGRAQSKLATEKTRLEASLSTLHTKLDAANRKVSITEITVQNVSKERDSALAQLSNAFYSAEELKAENRKLKKEIERLRHQIPEASQAKRTISSRTRPGAENPVLQERQNHTLPTSEPSVQVSRQPLQKQRRSKLSSQVESQVAKMAERKEEEDQLFSIHTGNRSRFNSTTHHNDASQGKENHRSPKKAKKKQVIVEVDATESDDSDEVDVADSPSTRPRQNMNSGHDKTYLSTIHPPAYVTDLRKDIEGSRARDREYEGQSKPDVAVGIENGRTRAERAASAPPAEPTVTRKSSLKNVTNTQNLTKDRSKMAGARNVLSYQPEDADADLSTNLDTTENISRPLSELHRRASDPNVTAKSNTSRRRARVTNDFADENMTSGFILPDVTISNAAHATHVQDPTSTLHGKTTHTHLSNAVQGVLNTIAPHDTENCMVCKRIAGPLNQVHTSSATTKKQGTIRIPAIVPPSLRVPAPMPDNLDPTVRPAQPPKIALAVVVKELSDEIAHLKVDLAKQQKLYYQTDPSLSRKRRQAVYDKVQKLMKAIEIKSDQVYRLNDVAEGEGMEMTREEIEVTIGLNDIVGQSLKEVTADRDADEDEDEESEERHGNTEPWEGFQSTGELTRDMNHL
ncbi:MAG: hypothetical protein Q9227_004237 [Pyrenula ochraceoflavens]